MTTEFQFLIATIEMPSILDDSQLNGANYLENQTTVSSQTISSKDNTNLPRQPSVQWNKFGDKNAQDIHLPELLEWDL